MEIKRNTVFVSNEFDAAGGAADLQTQSLSVDDYVALGWRMMRLYDSAGYEQAVVAFRHALELDPGSVEASAFLAETYSYWGFREELNGRESQSYYDLSLNLAEQSVRLGMHQPESHRALSVALGRAATLTPSAAV